MNFSELSRPLDISDIDFRVQSISPKGYATILAYKDARVDMARLDQAVGPLNWQRKHELISGNLYCHVGIYNGDINEWVWKSDVGTESMTEATKGQSSDSFKRACFNWGIGRELYDYPFISIKLNDDEWDNKSGKPRQTWNLRIREWRWYSEFTDGKITFLAAKDEKGTLRFTWGKMKPKQAEPEYKSAAVSTEVETVEVIPVVNHESNPAGLLKKKEEVQVDEERERAVAEYKTVFGKAPHGRMSTDSIINAVKEELTKLEKEEEVEEEEEFIIEPIIDSLSNYIPEIQTFRNAKEFGDWARSIVTKFIEIEPEDSIEEFKQLCNDHFNRIK